MYSLHNLHVHSGFHFLIFSLNIEKLSEVFKLIGTEFHYTDPKYRNKFFPLRILLRGGTSKAGCDLKFNVWFVLTKKSVCYL